MFNYHQPSKCQHSSKVMYHTSIYCCINKIKTRFDVIACIEGTTSSQIVSNKIITESFLNIMSYRLSYFDSILIESCSRGTNRIDHINEIDVPQKQKITYTTHNTYVKGMNLICIGSYINKRFAKDGIVNCLLIDGNNVYKGEMTNNKYTPGKWENEPLITTSDGVEVSDGENTVKFQKQKFP